MRGEVISEETGPSIESRHFVMSAMDHKSRMIVLSGRACACLSNNRCGPNQLPLYYKIEGGGGIQLNLHRWRINLLAHKNLCRLRQNAPALKRSMVELYSYNVE